MPISDEDLEKMQAKIRRELEPFFTKVLSKSDEDILEFKEEVMKFTDKCNDAIETYLSFVIDSDGKALLTSVKEQIFLLYKYLGMVEGLGNCIVDMLIMLLVVNGKDFHIESTHAPRIRHVYSLNDLEEAYVPLKFKLLFLKHYGIKTYPSIIDNDLRNEIAHLNFKIEKNKVIIRGKEVWEVVYPKITKLNLASQIVMSMFRELRDGW